MRVIGFELMAAAMLLAGASQVHAGFLTAMLNASPASINEGGHTQLTLSLSHSPYGYGSGGHYDYGRPSPSTSYGYEYYTGAGRINSFSGSIVPGDGRSSFIAGSGVYSNSFTMQRTMQYVTPGTYRASFNGSASLTDSTRTDHYIWHQTGWQYGEGHHDWARSSFSASSMSTIINASTQIHVGNLSPTITNINWAPTVLVDEVFSFSASATDPAGVAGNELISFGYDFDADGDYTDFAQSGSLNSSGTYSFNAAGTYTVGVRVTDGRGGQAFGSFDITALAPVPASSVPEPSSMALLGIGGIGIVIGAARRRRQQAA